MDTNAVKQMLMSMVPFIGTVGLELGDVWTGHSTATLPSRPEVHNHLGTAHAGAVYTLGESASGAVVLSLFADLMPGVFVALKSARVSHLKAAAGDVLATASVNGEPKAVRDDYEAHGKVDFDVNVALTVGDVPTAEIVFTWAVRAPR